MAPKRTSKEKNENVPDMCESVQFPKSTCFCCNSNVTTDKNLSDKKSHHFVCATYEMER